MYTTCPTGDNPFMREPVVSVHLQTGQTGKTRKKGTLERCSKKMSSAVFVYVQTVTIIKFCYYF